MPSLIDQNPLLPDDLKMIDSFIINALQNNQPGCPLEIILPVENELVQQLNTRLHQFIKGLHIHTTQDQVKISFTCPFDEEILRHQFLPQSQALLPIRAANKTNIEGGEKILALVTHAVVNYTEGDLFIDALSDVEAASANHRLEQIFQEPDNLAKKDRFDRVTTYLMDVEKDNSAAITKWLNFYKLSSTAYLRHAEDQRFSPPVLPNRYQVQCPKEQVSLLFKTLSTCAPGYEIPERIYLLEILWKLKSHQYVVHGGGRLIKNKLYSTSAANLVKQIEELLTTPIDFLGSIDNFKYHAQILFLELRKELKHKKTAKTSSSFGWWGYRDETTINLYSEILKLSEVVFPAIPEHIALRKILNQLQTHTYIINGLGKTIDGKKYSHSAANVVKKIDLFLSKPIDYTNEEEITNLKTATRELLKEIQEELSEKTKPTVEHWFGLGDRNLFTIRLYADIVNLCKITLRAEEFAPQNGII